jgi:hypothetical protein
MIVIFLVRSVRGISVLGASSAKRCIGRSIHLNLSTTGHRLASGKWPYSMMVLGLSAIGLIGKYKKDKYKTKTHFELFD